MLSKFMAMTALSHPIIISLPYNIDCNPTAPRTHHPCIICLFTL